MSDLTRDLVIAAEMGDLAGVDAAHAAGAEVDAQGPSAGALHGAAFSGHLPIVERLLEAGADPAVASAQGFTALHLAASKDETKVLRALLSAGAPVDAQTPAGGTPLHVALAARHIASARALLASGADPTIVDVRGRTALHTASASGDPKAVKLLLKHGVAVDVQGEDGDSALREAILAAFEPKGELSRWSTEGAMGGETVRYEISLGMTTIQRGDGTPRVLPSKELRQISKLSWAPPALGRLLDHVDVALALLKAGADPVLAGASGNTALHAACELGDPRLLKALAKAPGVDWAVANDHQTSPVHFAARSKRPDGLEVVLKNCGAGAVNLTDDNGYTPLHFAADVGGAPAIFHLLLAAGADTQAESTKPLSTIPAGITPAGVARHWKDEEAAAIIDAARGLSAQPAASKTGS